MDSDPTAASASAPLIPGAVDKVRLRFRKDGPLRWLSHHDLMRTFERILRRSELPVRRTQGFNPHPRLVFALAMPVGVVGRSEVAELELDEVLPAETIRQRLTAQTPAGLAILDVQRISPKQTAHVTGFTYAIQVPPDQQDATRQRIAEALRLTEWRVEREKPTRRTVDVRPFVRDLRLDANGWLEMDLWLTPTGTARTEELLRLVGLPDLIANGGVLERVRLELDTDNPTSGQP